MGSGSGATTAVPSGACFVLYTAFSYGEYCQKFIDISYKVEDSPGVQLLILIVARGSYRQSR